MTSIIPQPPEEEVNESVLDGNIYTNDGTVYIHNGANVSFYIPYNVQSPTLINSGTIITLSDYGWARGIQANSLSLQNSGIIATQGLSLEDTIILQYAFAIDIAGAASIHNEAGGQILAEGRDLAVGVFYGGQSFSEEPFLVNDGLIHANAVGADGTSIGVYHQGYGFVPQTIVNNGTIRADIAIYAIHRSEFGAGTRDIIENGVTGVLDGDVILDLAQDTFINDGTVIGNVDMGPDADVFSGSGTVSGFVNMGFGADSYTGSDNDDRAAGHRGDDTLSGMGGNDLLFGGFGDDVIIGGAGNDGLFGEWGDDTIIVEAGDYAEGGSGRDRIELSDYTFEAVHGGFDFDILAMATGARNFSLGALAIDDRVSGFEAIELQGGQQLAINAKDIAAFAGVALASFWVDATASDVVHLAGDWTRGEDIEFDGTAYQRWTQNDVTVLVTAVTTVTPNSAPQFGGLDAVAGGLAAFRPGEQSGLDYTDPATYLFRHLLPEDPFIVDSEEIFYSAGNAVFISETTNDLTNNGVIISVNDQQFPQTIALDLGGSQHSLVNNGLIRAEQLTEFGTVSSHYPTHALSMSGNLENSLLINNGEISAYSVSGNAIAIIKLHPAFVNYGIISAISEHTRAIGVNDTGGHNRVTGEQILFNYGLIYAEAGGFGGDHYNEGDRFVPEDYVATGIQVHGSLTNDGDILAVLGANAATDLVTVGVYSRPYLDPATITNNGYIAGTLSIKFDAYSAPNHSKTVINNGLLVGDIEFASSNDTYDGSNGELRGVVYGFEGNDTFIGSAFDDVFVGGTGQDVYYIQSQNDLVIEELYGSYDRIFSSASLYLFDNVEALTLEMGAGDLYGVGNALDNAITGNDGANLLIGGAGNDTIDGGAGVDYIFGEAGHDTLNGGDDPDALFGMDGNDTLIGGASFHTDTLVGGAGNDILRGDSGLNDYDLMDGGSGDDSYYVDTGADLTFEAAGGGTDTVYADVSNVNNAGVYLYANVENLVLLGTTAFGVGNELANVLTGSDSANWLLGGAGDDTLIGGAGGDVLFGEAGADTFLFEQGSGGDVIGDFASGEDVMDISSFGFESFAELKANFIQNGDVGAINLGTGDFIVLHNVQMDQLTAEDFIL